MWAPVSLLPWDHMKLDASAMVKPMDASLCRPVSSVTVVQPSGCPSAIVTVTPSCIVIAHGTERTCMKRQCPRTFLAILITTALAAVLFAPASVTAQPAAAPVTAAGQVDTRQQTFTVGGFIPDDQRPTARPPTDIEAARDTGNPWDPGTWPDTGVWRSRARPDRGGGLAAAGASRAGPRGTADATTPLRRPTR